MSREKLLHIEPQELKFCFELYKQAFCTIQLSNNSRHHVAFEVVPTDLENYLTQPNVGVILPGSTCNIQVTMLGRKEVPSDMYCRDEMLIKGVVASPGTTTEGAWKLFAEIGHAIEACRLRVIYFYPPPSLKAKYERPQADSSHLDIFKVIRLQNRDWLHFADWFMKGIITGLIWLIFWYLMFPHIWSFAFMIVILIAKVAKRLAFDSLQEWALRGVGYMLIHLLKVLLWGSENKSEISTKETNIRSEELLLNFDPLEIKFPFELKKEISCSLLATNKTNNYVAFKVKTTDPRKYCVKPNTGIISPRSTCRIAVIMQAQKKAPASMECKDKFLIQSVVAKPGATAKDVTPEMFNKDHVKVEEHKFKVMYVAPGQVPSPVAQVKTTVSRLIEEHAAAREQNDILRQELELLKHESDESEGASVAFVLITGILGVILGYVAKRI